MKKFPVAVIGGGWSGERIISLRSMQGVVSALQERGWAAQALDLLPDQGSPKPATPAFAQAVRLSALLPLLRRRKGTVAFLTLHGPGGEDGRIQGLLDLGGIRFTGSGVLASAVAMDKPLAKQLMHAAGVPVPGGFALRRGQTAPAMRLPVVVKPASQGSALGVTIAKTAAQMKAGLKAAWRFDATAIVEPYLKGRELTVGVLGDKALPVIEIVPEHSFYDFHSKYAKGGSRHLCPAPLSAPVAKRAQALALRAHRSLGCSGYSRVDMILSPGEAIHVLEVNTLPGMTSVSLMPEAAKAAGLTYTEMLEAMLEVSLKEAAWPSTKA